MPKKTKPKWKPPTNPRNVLIADWWDSSPCYWICDLTRLDMNDPVQAQYKAAIIEAVRDMSSFIDEGVRWPLAGQASVPDDVDWTNGRPEQVCHAIVLPPCQVDAYVVLHYP